MGALVIRKEDEDKNIDTTPGTGPASLFRAESMRTEFVPVGPL